MIKYHLTWQGTGALDLSQILDEDGIPILFTKPGDSVLLNTGTFNHPLIQNYIGHGIEVKIINTPNITPTPIVIIPLLSSPLLSELEIKEVQPKVPIIEEIHPEEIHPIEVSSTLDKRRRSSRERNR